MKPNWPELLGKSIELFINGSLLFVHSNGIWWTLNWIRLRNEIILRPSYTGIIITVNSRYLEICGDYLLQAQFTRSANQFALRVFGLVKKSPMPNYVWRNLSKHIFDSDRRFEFHRI